MNNGMIIFISVLAYGAIVVYIGVRGRSINTTEGYFLASRSFGWFIMVCSVTMGIFSGLAFYGSPAFFFRSGSGTTAATGFFMTGLLYPAIGYKLWKIGKEKGYVTAADYLRDRYYSPGYGNLVSLLQLIFIIPYMALQFIAIGNGISISSGGFVSFEISVILFAVFIGIYVYFGGAKGIGWLDIFNALIGLILPLVTAFFIVNKLYDGSWAAMSQTAFSKFPEMMDFPGKEGLWTPGNIFAYMLSGNIVLIVAPHILPKLYMAKSKDTFKQMAVAGPLMYCWLAIGIMMLGMIGVSVYKDVLPNAQSDILVPKLVAENAPIIFTIMLLWALFAFATSTSDAFGLSAASIISHDLVGRYGFKNIKDETERDSKCVKIGKISVLCLMPIMIIIAILKPTYIVNYAYSFASPGFAQIFPAILLGLYWKRATKEAAITGTTLGLITLALTLFVWKWPMGIHPIIWSMGVNFISFFLVTFVTAPPKSIVYEYHLKYEDPNAQIVGLSK